MVSISASFLLWCRRAGRVGRVVVRIELVNRWADQSVVNKTVEIVLLRLGGTECMPYIPPTTPLSQCLVYSLTGNQPIASLLLFLEAGLTFSSILSLLESWDPPGGLVRHPPAGRTFIREAPNICSSTRRYRGVDFRIIAVAVAVAATNRWFYFSPPVFGI